MSVLVAIKTKQSVWIGADGRVSGETRTLGNDFVKWRNANGIWWGAAGYVRLYGLADMAPDAFNGVTSCLELCEALRGLVKADGWVAEGFAAGAPVNYGIEILATDGVEILHYDGDGCYVTTLHDGGYTAIGSGAEYALGALYAAAALHPNYKVEIAIASACAFDPGCGGAHLVIEVSHVRTAPDSSQQKVRDQ